LSESRAMFNCCVGAPEEVIEESAALIGTDENVAPPADVIKQAEVPPPAAAEEPNPNEAMAEEETKKEEPKEEPKKEEKAAAPAPPPLPSQNFQVLLDTTKDTIGMLTDHRCGSLSIVDVFGGTSLKHNEASPLELHMRPNDFLVRVNGKTTPEGMLQELAAKGKKTVDVQHPAPIVITVKKDGKPLGLKLAFVSSSSSVGITEVMDGACLEYNRTVEDHLQVKNGDRILTVNGASLDVSKMVQNLKTEERVELTLARLSP